MIGRAAAIAGMLLLAGGAVAEDSTPPADGSLTVSFQGVTRREGVVLCAVFDSKAAYDANTGAVRTLELPAADGNFSATFAGLPPGRYAVKAFHDRDANGRMRFNPLGMPQEPYGFSNNARGAFGPPSWKAAGFTLAPGPNSIAIRLK